jgi:hypothetical protein
MKKANVGNNSQIPQALTLKKNQNANTPILSNDQKVFIGEGEGEEAMKAAQCLWPDKEHG